MIFTLRSMKTKCERPSVETAALAQKQCSNCRGVGGLNPLPHLADPLPLVKIQPRGGRVSTPHLCFAEVGMLLPSHFLLMQFLKYLQCDDLNVTIILIHIED